MCGRCRCIPESRLGTSTTGTRGNIVSSSADDVPCAALGTSNAQNDKDRECNEHGDNCDGNKKYSAGNSRPADAAVDTDQILSATGTDGKSSAAASVDGAVACECIGADCDSEDGIDDDGYSETDEDGCSMEYEDDCSDG